MSSNRPANGDSEPDPRTPEVDAVLDAALAAATGLQHLLELAR